VLGYGIKNVSSDSANQRWWYNYTSQQLSSKSNDLWITIDNQEGRIVIWDTQQYSYWSFSLVPIPPTYNITIYNAYSYDLNLTFTNAPASEPQTVWVVPANSNATYSFLSGSSVSVSTNSGTDSYTIHEDASLLFIPTAKCQSVSEDDISGTSRKRSAIAVPEPDFTFPNYVVGQQIQTVVPTIGRSDFTFVATLNITRSTLAPIISQISTPNVQNFEIASDFGNNIRVKGLAGANLVFPLSVDLNQATTIGFVRKGGKYTMFVDDAVVNVETFSEPAFIPRLPFQVGSKGEKHFYGSITSAKLWLSAVNFEGAHTM